MYLIIEVQLCWLLLNSNINIIQHPPYNPELGLCDFFTSRNSEKMTHDRTLRRLELNLKVIPHTKVYGGLFKMLEIAAELQRHCVIVW